MAEMIGINQDAYDDVLLRIYKIKEELNITFNNISSSVDMLNDCYKSNTGKEFIEAFKVSTDINFERTLDNIDTYIKDLKTAKTNIEIFQTKLSAQIIDDPIMK